MVSELLINEVKNSIGKGVIFFIKDFRFEGKIIDVDDEFLKYYDNRKFKPCLKKFCEISELEVLE